MKIAYVRPYEGEIAIAQSTAPEHEFISVVEVAELTEAARAEIEVLSVFVDYKVTPEIFDLLPNLKLIATRSSGYDHIDLQEAVTRNVAVCRVPHYGSRTVAEYALALMFALSRNTHTAYADLQRSASITNLEKYEGFDLFGKTLGVIGTGAIGRSVCQIARGIGMQVLAFDIAPDQTLAEENGMTYASLDEVLAQSDIVTLHVPAMPQTHHLLNEEKIALMKKGSYVINTARGEIIDTKALVQALRSGYLAGAGLDVLEGEHSLHEEAELLSDTNTDAHLWETLVADHSLIDMQNVIVTPHIAFNTIEAKREITDITVANVQSFATGVPVHTVSA